jgi:16S rRNA (uracil1498-N3)-methyltransferase
MKFPFFYIEKYDPSQQEFILDEDTSRHVIQVLRMKEGERLNLTEGKGKIVTAQISNSHKKHCTVQIIAISEQRPATRSIVIAISLLKNTSRFEWFLEKATEIGVSEIMPLVCERTEKQKFRYERMKQICISAMLQSQQCWLPVLHEPVRYLEYMNLNKEKSDLVKLIAHCAEETKQSINELHMGVSSHCHICIGPEGDFTKQEIDAALQSGFLPVSLGETRLRSETAGVVAVVLTKLG